MRRAGFLPSPSPSRERGWEGLVEGVEDEAGGEFGDEVGAFLGHEAAGVGRVDHVLEGWRGEDESDAGGSVSNGLEEFVEVVGVRDGLASGEGFGVDAEERFEDDVLQDGGSEGAPGVGDVVGHGSGGGVGRFEVPDALAGDESDR